jgi:endonuclease/exonuclease/phosphatase family metal-dependent hydrolase
MIKKNLSVLTYNVCYGLKANTTLRAYNSTFRVVHKRKDPKEISAKSDFNEVFDLVKELSPDIVVLNEIFRDLQTHLVTDGFRHLGYDNIFIGDSGHHEVPLRVSTMVASKYKAKQIENKFRFPEGLPGTGGGAVSLCFEELELCLLGVHTACFEKYLPDHLQNLEDFYSEFSKKYRNLIIVGDLNREAKFYRDNTNFMKEMNAVSAGRTFPSFFPWYNPFKPLYKNLLSGQIDNLFYKGDISVIESKVIDGKRSDHKPLFVRMKIGV